MLGFFISFGAIDWIAAKWYFCLGVIHIMRNVKGDREGLRFIVLHFKIFWFPKQILVQGVGGQFLALLNIWTTSYDFFLAFTFYNKSSQLISKCFYTFVYNFYIPLLILFLLVSLLVLYFSRFIFGHADTYYRILNLQHNT